MSDTAGVVAESGPVANASDEEAKQEETIKQEETELDKYWKAVNDNPSDFTGWTYLLQYVEQDSDVESASKAFDAFLARYPYCYGYWKKYADIYKKNDQLADTETVYISGLKAIPLSTDLWMHYINFMKERGDVSYERLHQIFEDAVSASGTDFRSHRLWDMYITWETENNNLKKVTAIYDRVIAIPLQHYNSHFENFQKFVNAHQPKELLSLDEFLKLRKEVVSESSTEVDLKAPGLEDSEDAPPGVAADDPAPGVADQATDAESSAEETKLLREKIIEVRKRIYMITEEHVGTRWTFEEGIRRPYFHVKPLERVQLKNWEDYLDFEIEYGSHERVLILFERCLIACALYEEMWLKYARYLEPHSEEGVEHVYKRGCTIHLPKKSNLHLAWSAYHESKGNFERAQEILESFEKATPGLMCTQMRLINLLRRQNQHDKVADLYETNINNASDLAVKSAYSMRYARYVNKIMKDPSKAKEILTKALEDEPGNIKLHLQQIDIEFQQTDMNEQNILKAFDVAIAESTSVEHKAMFEQRKIEYLEDFGSDPKLISIASIENEKTMKEVLLNKKRKAEGADDTPAAKKAKGDGSTANGAATETTISTATVQQATATNGTSSTATPVADPNSQYYSQQWSSYHQGYQYPQSSWGNYYQPQHAPHT